MKPDQRHLIHDLLDGERDARREATLLAGGRILRRRRQLRVAARGLFFLAVLVVAGFWFARTNPHQTIAHAPMQVDAPVASTQQPQAMTDDELLALFPNTPVGLATLADGRKRLIFPHPGDEQRFVTRL
jgi:hypothetical protein